MKTASEELLKGYYQNTLDQETRSNFEKSVNNGSIIVPDWFEFSPDSKLNISPEFTPPTTSGAEQPDVMQIAPDSKIKAVIPSVDEQKRYYGQHGNPMTDEERKVFEDKVYSGEYELPDWFELRPKDKDRQAIGLITSEYDDPNKVYEQATEGMMGDIAPYARKADTLMDGIKELFTGEKRSTEYIESLKNLRDIKFPKGELFGIPMPYSKGFRAEKAFLSSLVANPDELTDIYIEQLGKNPETGEYARRHFDKESQSWVLYNPHDQSYYGIKPGFRPEDAIRLSAAIAAETAVGKGTGWLSKASKGTKYLEKLGNLERLKDTGSVVGGAVREAAIQGAYETMESVGGSTKSPDEGAMAQMGAIGAFTSAGDRALKAVGANRAVDMAISYAKKDNPQYLEELAKNNPEFVNYNLETKGYSPYVEGEKFSLSPDMTNILRDITKDKKLTNEQKQMFANFVRTKPEVIKAAMDQGWMDYLTIREIIDPSDTKTMAVIDSVADKFGTGGDSLLKKRDRAIVNISEDVNNKIKSMGKTDSIDELSKNTTDLMVNASRKYKQNADKYYAEVGSYIPEGAEYNVNNALDFIDKVITERTKRKLPDGWIMTDLDGNDIKVKNKLDVLNDAQREVYEILSPQVGVYKGAPTREIIGTQQIKDVSSTKESVIGKQDVKQVGESLDMGTGAKRPLMEYEQKAGGRVSGVKRDPVTGAEIKSQEVVEGQYERRATDPRQTQDLVTGKAPEKEYIYSTYDNVNAAREIVGESLEDNPSNSYLYSLLTKDQNDFIASQSQNIGERGLLAWELAKTHHKGKLAMEQDLQNLVGQKALKTFNKKVKAGDKDASLDADFVGKVTAATKSLAKGELGRLKTMYSSIPKPRRKEVLDKAVFNAIKEGSDGLGLDSYADWWVNLMGKKESVKFLRENMNKDSFKLMNDLGQISVAIKRSGKEFGMTGDELKGLISQKDAFVTSLLQRSAMMVGAGVMAKGLGDLSQMAIGGTIGALGLSMQALSFFRDQFGKGSSEQFMRAVDIIKDPTIDKFLKSGFKQSDIKEVSNSKKFLQWAKQMGVAHNRSELERYITKAIRLQQNISEEAEGPENNQGE